MIKIIYNRMKVFFIWGICNFTITLGWNIYYSTWQNQNEDNILYNRKKYILPLQIEILKKQLKKSFFSDSDSQKNFWKTVKIHQKQNKV